MEGRQPVPQFSIWEDPAAQQSQRPRRQLQPSPFPLQPVPTQMPQHGVVFDPRAYPQSHPMSPQKMHNQMQEPPVMMYDQMQYVPSLPIPDHRQRFQESPIKRTPPTAPPQFAPPPPPHMQQNPMGSDFDPNLNTFDQESYPNTAANDNADFPSPSYNRRVHLKRSFSDVAPVTDKGNKRLCVENETAFELPEPQDMPPIEDMPNGEKPPYSYAQLIAMAILRAPQRKLTLSQIYAFIQETWLFYKQDPRVSWHNSIRHNLSLNKSFAKVERPKNDPGKGSYWQILPGNESQFMKTKNRSANNNSNIILHSVMHTEQISLSQPGPAVTTLAPSPFMQECSPPERPKTAPALPELSSDATVPASDSALDQEDEDEVRETGSAQPGIPKSSPPDALDSSPPVVLKGHRRSESSPSTMRPFQSSNAKPARSQPFNDSGFWSSLSSSVLRPNSLNSNLDSEFDLESSRKKAKVGRAEDEIKRIRRSPRDVTPSQRRSSKSHMMLAPPTSSPQRSSPLLRAPMTPAQGFKKPALPIPDSVSPTTQLNNFRAQMRAEESAYVVDPSPVPELHFTDPIHSLSDLSPYGWSATPGRGMGNSNFVIYDDTTQLTPAQDYANNLGITPLQSVKRPNFGRTITSTNALCEIQGNAATRRLTAALETPSKMPVLKPTSGQILTGSPLKGVMVSTMDNDENVFSNFLTFGDNESDDDNTDLVRGFEPIMNKRPSLGSRSYTTQF